MVQKGRKKCNSAKTGDMKGRMCVLWLKECSCNATTNAGQAAAIGNLEY